MPPLTLSQAAKRVAKSKTQLSRMVKSGKLSGTRQENGEILIDPSELYRVYPPVKPTGTPGTSRGDATGDSESDETERLRNELYKAQTEAAELRRRVDDVTGDRDSWRNVAERLILALPAMAKQPEPVATEQPKATEPPSEPQAPSTLPEMDLPVSTPLADERRAQKRPSFWQRLFGQSAQAS